jgi:outer membrane protein
VNASRSAWFPQISLSYSRNRTAADTTFNLSCCAGAYSGQFRFTLSWTVFNQWQRESSIVAADVAAANADATARDAKYAARQSLVQDYGALRTAQEQSAIQIVSVDAAEENLRVEQERYRLGVASILDVLTAQSTVNSARLLLIQARFNYRVAKSQLEALLGRDL